MRTFDLQDSEAWPRLLLAAGPHATYNAFIASLALLAHDIRSECPYCHIAHATLDAATRQRLLELAEYLKSHNSSNHCSTNPSPEKPS